MTYGLTKRQADALRFIREYMAQNDGVSPSYSEIAVGIGLSHRSKSTVFRMVRELEQRGAVALLRDSKRSIHVVVEGSR